MAGTILSSVLLDAATKFSLMVAECRWLVDRALVLAVPEALVGEVLRVSPSRSLAPAWCREGT